MRGRDKREGRRDDFAPRKAHGLIAELKGQRAIAEKRQIRRRHIQAARQLRVKTRQHRSVIRQPPISPDLLAAGHELVQRRQIGARHENRLVKARHRLILSCLRRQAPG